jgi:hypothetical protein
MITGNYDLMGDIHGHAAGQHLLRERGAFGMKLYFGPNIDKPVTAALDVQGYLEEDKKHQYRDKYSMAEAAKSWVCAKGCLPESIAAIVGSNDLNVAHFEFPAKVWGGGTAMTDVMAFIPNGVIAVEAKVNEPFDDVVSDWIEREAKRKPDSPPHRRKVVQRYADALVVDAEHLLGIRYQLLQRVLCASIVARAKGLSEAWMIVQHFPRGDASDKIANRSDFDAFVALVGKAPVIEGVKVQLGWATG